MQPALLQVGELVQSPVSTFFLWFTTGGMLLGTVLFLYWATTGQPQNYHHYITSAVITLWASMMYIVMATGSGLAFIEAENRIFYYARYIDWTITTPLLLLGLAWVALGSIGRNPQLVLGLVVADVAMILTGVLCRCLGRRVQVVLVRGELHLLPGGAVPDLGSAPDRCTERGFAGGEPVLPAGGDTDGPVVRLSHSVPHRYRGHRCHSHRLRGVPLRGAGHLGQGWLRHNLARWCQEDSGAGRQSLKALTWIHLESKGRQMPPLLLALEYWLPAAVGGDVLYLRLDPMLYGVGPDDLL